MRNDPKAAVLQTVETLFRVGTTSSLTDADLLDRFVSSEGELASAAFEVIVNRHGPMVFDICRNAVRDLHEAEDAFQATFLVLARQARSIRKRGSMASWLFGVASRVAARARSDAARRRLLERKWAEQAAARERTDEDRSASALLHEAVASLPENYRDPIVLCDLEGLTYQAAAERLGCPIGTVSVRLMRARAQIRNRLLRQGESARADLLSRRLAEGEAQCISPGLIAATVEHASGSSSPIGPGLGPVPIQVARIAEGVIQTMVYKQVMALAAATVACCVVLAGAGITCFEALGGGSQEVAALGQPPGPSSRTADNPVDAATEAVNRARSINNLKSIIIGVLSFEQANGFLPPPAIRDPNTGKHLLSWRVAILPWLGAQDLYQKFDLNEAWDGPQNKSLLDQMPAIYAGVGANVHDPHGTFYQVFVGPGTAFESLEGGGKLLIPSITDGAANTLVVVEAGQTVPWTKPADLPFDPNGPLPRLGGLFKDGFGAAFVDASVRFVGRGADPQEQERLLKAFITRNGKEKISLDQLPQVPVRRPISEEAEPKNLPPVDQAKKAAAIQPSNPPADPVKKGAIAQIEVARNAIRTLEQMRSSGQAASERDYAEWSVRLMQAKRDFASTKAGEIEALEAHAARMKDSRERALRLYQAGEASMLQYLDATYRFNEATTWVEKAKAEEVRQGSR